MNFSNKLIIIVIISICKGTFLPLGGMMGAGGLLGLDCLLDGGGSVLSGLFSGNTNSNYNNKVGSNISNMLSNLISSGVNIGTNVGSNLINTLSNRIRNSDYMGVAKNRVSNTATNTNSNSDTNTNVNKYNSYNHNNYDYNSNVNNKFNTNNINTNAYHQTYDRSQYNQNDKFIGTPNSNSENMYYQNTFQNLNTNDNHIVPFGKPSGSTEHIYTNEHVSHNDLCEDEDDSCVPKNRRTNNRYKPSFSPSTSNMSNISQHDLNVQKVPDSSQKQTSHNSHTVRNSNTISNRNNPSQYCGSNNCNSHNYPPINIIQQTNNESSKHNKPILNFVADVLRKNFLDNEQ